MENKTPDNNKIDLAAYLETCPTDEKGNKVVPDDFFDINYRDLPIKVVNASGTWRTTPTGGKIKILGGDPEADKAIHKAGAEAINATNAQRRTMRETLDILLKQAADVEDSEQYNLPAGATKQDALMVAMYKAGMEGNIKAGQFIRDTIGEQPTAKQEITADIMTDHDRDLIQKLEEKLMKK